MRKPIVPKRIEVTYRAQLRRVAHVVGLMIAQHTHIEKDDKGNIARVILSVGLQEMVRNYSKSIAPWAQKIAQEMVDHVSSSNKKFLLDTAPQMAKQLKSDYDKSAIGLVAKSITADQVTLIKSIPLEAGQRAQEYARQAVVGSMRASEVADKIMASGDVAKSRADTIARTEIHKAWSSLTQSRAQYVGANQYIWRTAGDEIVRDSHAEMDGQVCDFNSPPTLSDGDSYNAGEGVNCRCYAEPIISDKEE